MPVRVRPQAPDTNGLQKKQGALAIFSKCPLLQFTLPFL